MLWRFWSWSVQFCSDFLCPDCFLIKAILFKINSFLIIILYGLLNDFSLKENKYHLKIHRNEEKSSDTAYTIHRNKVISYRWSIFMELNFILGLLLGSLAVLKTAQPNLLSATFEGVFLSIDGQKEIKKLKNIIALDSFWILFLKYLIMDLK